MYKGYRIIKGTTDQINNALADTSDLLANEYVIIQNDDDGSEDEMRWDGERFVSLSLPPQKLIKAKNSLQRCALDMLLNKNITICALAGPAGSGKSLLSMQMAKYLVLEKGQQSKIIGVRSPIGTGKQVGYIKGSFEQKTENFFVPMSQHLEGGKYEMESLMDREVLQTMIPYYMKGFDLHDSIILVEEVEDLTEKEIKLVGSRVADNSRIFMVGDYNQSEKRADITNPFVRAIEGLKGSKLFACVYLDEDLRSETSKLFSTLYNEELENK